MAYSELLLLDLSHLVSLKHIGTFTHAHTPTSSQICTLTPAQTYCADFTEGGGVQPLSFLHEGKYMTAQVQKRFILPLDILGTDALKLERKYTTQIRIQEHTYINVCT